MQELADSNGLIGDRDALAGLAGPGRIPVLPRLAAAGDGAIDRRGHPWPAASRRLVARPGRTGGGSTIREALADPAFRAAITSPGLNQIPYLPPLRGLVQQLLGPPAFSYPAKVLRAVAPGKPRAGPVACGGGAPDGRSGDHLGNWPLGRYVHYDYAVSGVQDMLTSWVPLMDIPVRPGGLAVRPGGHLAAPVPPQVLGCSASRAGRRPATTRAT